MFTNYSLYIYISIDNIRKVYEINWIILKYNKDFIDIYIYIFVNFLSNPTGLK